MQENKTTIYKVLRYLGSQTSWAAEEENDWLEWYMDASDFFFDLHFQDSD